MNKKLKKAVAAACMCAAVCSATPLASLAETAVVPVNQEQEYEVAPCLLYISDITSMIGISGTTAEVYGSVEGYANTATKAKVVVELQVQSSTGSWVPVVNWTVTENDYRAEVDDTYTVKTGNTYRVKTTATVWEGSASETSTLYSPEKTA